MASEQPVRTDTFIGLTFGDDDDRENASLSTALRATADWIDQNEDAWVGDVVVGYADEFSTWWITLYVDAFREQQRVTDEWQQQQAEYAEHQRQIEREVEAELALKRGE